MAKHATLIWIQPVITIYMVQLIIEGLLSMTIILWMMCSDTQFKLQHVMKTTGKYNINILI